MMDESASITIAVRVRPPTSWEQERLPDPELVEPSYRGDGQLSTPRRVTSATPLKEVVSVMDDKVLVFDKADEVYEQKGYFPPGSKRSKNRRFIFDRVFDPNARQMDVYDGTTRPLLDSLLDGFNATVFAYGATGCGKTHTISGTPEDPGIIYLAMADLFQRIEDRKDEVIVEVHVTFLEIYNEEIRDLLADGSTYAPKGGLAIREDKTVKVIGLTELQPAHADEVKEIVKAGNARRTQSPTHANETSSRSHAVLQIHVTQAPRTAGTTEQRTMATLSIIDLAGSERASATKNMGQRMVEGANINKSLLALGNCINALCESSPRSRHIPYRNSKLTRLLKFSLGGNCKTVMIVCVAPTSQHFEDTFNTLQYADRAKMIKTKVTRNLINVDRHVGQYVEAINRLNEEVKELKAKLAGKLSHELEIARRKAAEAKAEMERVRADIQAKADQVRSSIVTAATCEANLHFAQAQLSVLKPRISQIDAQGLNGPLPSDLAAERGLLQAMVSANDALVRPGSTLNATIQKAGASNSLFDALLRAVTERRTNRLEDTHVETIQLDARTKRAEMDKLKAEAERDGLKAAAIQQAELVSSLVGMLGRCTVMLQDGCSMLQTAMESPPEVLREQAQVVSDALRKLAESNDQTFSLLTGQSTAPLLDRAAPCSLTNFVAHHVPKPIPASATKPPLSKTRRRSSHLPASPIRSHKRTSLVIRPSITKPGLLPRSSYTSALRSQGVEKEKKSLRWKDEAGGELVDASAVISVVETGPTNASKQLSLNSESEWEDEKTEDSVCLNTSLLAMAAKPQPLKPRSSRVDPNYLRAKRGFTLSSLAEDDENAPIARKVSPLMDKNFQQPTPQHSLKMPIKSSFPLGVQDDNTPPSRLSEVNPRPATLGRSGRRRSNIGPVRSEKSRRRSSMLQQPSPAVAVKSGGARRILITSDLKSPAKRAKRLSLLGPARTAVPQISVVKANLSMLESSMDFSLRAGSKAAWR